MAGAVVTWTITGTNGRVDEASAATDSRGQVSAVWVLGTNASEAQRLTAQATVGKHRAVAALAAVAKPVEISSVAFSTRDTTIVKLGVAKTMVAQATDPFGNRFVPVGMRFVSLDTALFAVDSTGLVQVRKRGFGCVVVAAGSATDTAWVHATQVVQTIVATPDTLRFHSLGQTVTLNVQLVDDQGHYVKDSLPVDSLPVDTIVKVQAGKPFALRSVSNGATPVILQAGGVKQAVHVLVNQQAASVKLSANRVNLDALGDTMQLSAQLADSVGAPLAGQVLSYTSTDSSIVAVAQTGQVTTRGNGAAWVRARTANGVNDSLRLLVAQQVARVVAKPDSLVFSALQAVLPVQVVAQDRLGAQVAGATIAFATANPAVVTADSSGNARAVSNGITVLTAVHGADTATIVAKVAQVPTTLTVSVIFSNPVLTLPPGSPLPLQCRASDRNGFEIAGEPTLVGTLRGTVTGTRCSDARVVRSGYDTLSFALGNTQARVPVIVATVPDSVGVLATAQPLPDADRIRFVGEDLSNPYILALRPLVQDILAAYGNPASNLDRARAIRDWVARTAVSSDPAIHYDGSTSNLSVLPAGTTWADVNALLTEDRWNAEVSYWGAGYPDGYTMLDRLLGTLDLVSGQRAPDGLMEHVTGAQYRIRDINSYHYLACTFQTLILSTLWQAAGLHGMLASTLNHDPAAVFIPEMGRWVYEDPTFDEEYLLDGAGAPLSPTDLLSLSTGGQAGRLYAAKIPGPTFDPEPYNVGWRYLDAGHPEGMVIMGSQLYGPAVANHYWTPREVQIDVPILATEPAPWSDPTVYVPVTPGEAFPTLSPIVTALSVNDSVDVVQLTTTFPNHQHFERRLGGQAWQTVQSTDILPVGACKVEYRSVDAVGNVSASAVLDVWAPRAQGFLTSAAPGSVRSQAPYCVSAATQ